MNYRRRAPGGCAWAALVIVTLAAGGCGGFGSESPPSDSEAPTSGSDPQPAAPPAGTDTELRQVIADRGLTGDPTTGRTLPDIGDPLAQLGMRLFFAKSLSGQMDSACVSCHHPVLGGGDDLAVSVGVDAVDPDLLGVGRVHAGGLPNVGRNSPTLFNVALNDASMFLDSRIESLGKLAGRNGAGSGISTPASGFGAADPDAGDNLPMAQARVPVTTIAEMRSATFEVGSTPDEVRAHIAARIGGYGIGAGELAMNEWLPLFQAAYPDAAAGPVEDLVTEQNIARAIGEYVRTLVFVDTPWKAYVEGDDAAITDQAKRGALLFLRLDSEGGVGCVACHSGDRFSDDLHHVIGFPQLGPGKGDGPNGTDDFGRERVTGNTDDRYAFRTSSLLNLDVSAPYGHAGAYQTLEQVMAHYADPEATVQDFLAQDRVCEIAQFADLPNCASLFPDLATNSNLHLQRLLDLRAANLATFSVISLSAAEQAEIVAFLHTLTDPRTRDRTALSPFIADPSSAGPDGTQQNARDRDGALL